jgi:poly-gamma-glutamate capsule biosynthesis protein CapA/YwtB (metallophosphatase superfamily)
VRTKRSKPRKIVSIIAAGALLIAVGFGVWWYLTQYNKPSVVTQTKTDTISTPIKEVSKPLPLIHIAAMGDMLAHDTIIANATIETSYNFGHYFQNIRSSYQNADVIFCDQEGLSSGEAFGISGYPSFNAPTEFASGLQSGAGCNLINLANNHMGDKGTAAIDATIDVWNALHPLAVTGANKSVEDQNIVKYATVKGIKIGFLAFADFNNNNTPAYAVNIYHDEDLVRRLVTEARSNADIVLVSMHWGVEDSATVSSDQINETNLLSSLGVDVIIGTGPHVLQRFETIDREDGGKTYVWYSLGNMLSSQLNTPELFGGIAQFDATKETSGKITINNFTFTPTYMHYEWTANEAANGDLLARRNVMIYMLNLATEPLSRSLLNTTVDEQKQYIIDTLGPEITVR